MDLGFPEIVVILVIVLVLFGGAKLPQLGESLGKGIRSFKDAMAGKDDEPAKSAPGADAPPAAPAPSEAGKDQHPGGSGGATSA